MKRRRLPQEVGLLQHPLLGAAQHCNNVPRWRENSCSEGAACHHGSQKKRKKTVNVDSLQSCLNSTHKLRLISKELKTSSNYHVSASQLHHQRHHRPLFSTRRRGYTQLRLKQDDAPALMQVHGGALDSLDISSLVSFISTNPERMEISGGYPGEQLLQMFTVAR